MKLLTKQLREKLATNYRKQQENELDTDTEGPIDFEPVVKFFSPYGAATWLFTEIDEDNILFGLCDLGMGCPELGYASLKELEMTKFRGVLPFVERDKFFRATKTLSEYAEEARKQSAIQA